MKQVEIQVTIDGEVYATEVHREDFVNEAKFQDAVNKLVKSAKLTVEAQRDKEHRSFWKMLKQPITPWDADDRRYQALHNVETLSDRVRTVMLDFWESRPKLKNE